MYLVPTPAQPFQEQWLAYQSRRQGIRHCHCAELAGWVYELWWLRPESTSWRSGWYLGCRQVYSCLREWFLQDLPEIWHLPTRGSSVNSTSMWNGHERDMACCLYCSLGQASRWFAVALSLETWGRVCSIGHYVFWQVPQALQIAPKIPPWMPHCALSPRWRSAGMLEPCQSLASLLNPFSIPLIPLQPWPM